MRQAQRQDARGWWKKIERSNTKAANRILADAGTTERMREWANKTLQRWGGKGIKEEGKERAGYACKALSQPLVEVTNDTQNTDHNNG